MSRIVLIHADAAEAERQAARLRRAGHRVVVIREEGGPALRALRSSPPEALVIGLDRRPTYGRDTAIFLRQQKATRRVPIVFAGGETGKVAGVRRLLPDAVFTDWSRIRGSLRRAIERPPADPVVPGTMAGYSGTPLPKKLGVRAGATLILLGSPDGFEQTLGTLPEGVRVRKQARGQAGVVILFAKSRADLIRRLPVAERVLAEGGGLWIAWRKKAAGGAGDLDQSAVRATGLEAGLVDYKICAIDETWSGLCFARRRAKRGTGRR